MMGRVKGMTALCAVRKRRCLSALITPCQSIRVTNLDEWVIYFSRTYFLLFADKKVPKKRPPLPNCICHGKGMAIRCCCRGIFSDMVLVFCLSLAVIGL